MQVPYKYIRYTQVSWTTSTRTGVLCFSSSFSDDLTCTYLILQNLLVQDDDEPLLGGVVAGGEREMLNISGIDDSQAVKSDETKAAGKRAATAIKSSQRWLATVALLDAALCSAFFGVGSPDHYCDPVAAIKAASADDTTIDLIGVGMLRIGLVLLWSVKRLPLLASRIEAALPTAPAAAVAARRQLAAVTMVSVGLSAGKVAALFILHGSQPDQGGLWMVALAGGTALLSYTEHRIAVGALAAAATRLQESADTAEDDDKPKVSKATIKRLLSLAFVDWPWLLMAFFFLIIAAAGQTLLPLLTGKAIDAIAFSGVTGNAEFYKYIWQLCVASVVTGVCSGQV